MLNKILNTIVSYIEFLKKEFNLNITIHDCTEFLSPHMHRLVPYNIHSNPYCLYIKSEKVLWQKCINRQDKVMAHCDKVGGDFFGMCYAGVEEYVCPIIDENEKLGFISVSGYKNGSPLAKLKIDHLCSEYSLNKETTLQNYDEYLTSDIPSQQFIKNVITPLCHLFVLLRVKSKDLYGGESSNFSNSDHVLGHVLSYIEFNYRSDIKITDISKACHCSVSYISHLFKKRKGLTLRKYIGNLRLKEAKRLLTVTDMPIQQVAFASGFTDANYFSRCFKETYNIPPSQYRSQHKLEQKK